MNKDSSFSYTDYKPQLFWLAKKRKIIYFFGAEYSGKGEQHIISLMCFSGRNCKHVNDPTKWIKRVIDFPLNRKIRQKISKKIYTCVFLLHLGKFWLNQTQKRLIILINICHWNNCWCNVIEIHLTIPILLSVTV